MPTIYLHEVTLSGAEEALKLARNDSAWEASRSLSMYPLDRQQDGASAGILRYRYEDDYKRPGPDLQAVANRHPSVRVVHEVLDEFADAGLREVYEPGEAVAREFVDPREFSWVEWEDRE